MEPFGIWGNLGGGGPAGESLGVAHKARLFEAREEPFTQTLAKGKLYLNVVHIYIYIYTCIYIYIYI